MKTLNNRLYKWKKSQITFNKLGGTKEKKRKEMKINENKSNNIKSTTLPL
jgi:hypothetical protein